MIWLFSKILDLCTNNNLFLCNNQLYMQLIGAPMRRSISPTQANIFLCHHEENWIDNWPPEFKSIFYRWYVDNTFVLFINPLQIQPFIQYLNIQRYRMKFTLESERNNSNAFFNVNIVKHNTSFVNNLYRKPTFTGLRCKYDSATSEVYKTGLITCLNDRAYKISPIFQTFCSELEYSKKYSSQTNIPLKLLKIPCATSWTSSSLFILPWLQSINKYFSFRYHLCVLKLTSLSARTLRNLLPKFTINSVWCLFLLITSLYLLFFNYKYCVTPPFSLVTRNVVFQYIYPKCSETWPSRHKHVKIT